MAGGIVGACSFIAQEFHVFDDGMFLTSENEHVLSPFP